MCDTPFKTPLPHRSTYKTELNKECLFSEKGTSDSDESVASSNSDYLGSGSSNGDISLVAEFDDFMRYFRPLRSGELQTQLAFIEFVEQVKQFYINYFEVINECKRLQTKLETTVNERSDLEYKLLMARNMLDQEKQKTRNVKKERNDLVDTTVFFSIVLHFHFYRRLKLILLKNCC